MVLLVQVGDGVDEAVGDTVLVVQINSLLDGIVANHVTLCEVLCNDTGSWLVLLCNLVGVALGVGCVVCVIVVAS